MIQDWLIEKRKLKDLKPLENNPRKISKEDLKQLQEDLKVGHFKPLILDNDSNILGGNQTYKILLQENGEDFEVNCSIPDHQLTQDERNDIIILDNVNRGEFEIDKLQEEFEDSLKRLGLEDLLPEVELEVKEDDYEEPEELPIRVHTGEIWQLGKHRLMCGDSTKIEDVEKLMNGQKADMVFTDPPYGMKYEPNHSKSRSSGYNGAGYHNVKNQEMIVGDDIEFDPGFLLGYFNKTKEIFLWGCDYYFDKIIGFKEGSLFVWNKRYGIEDIVFNTSHFELCWSKERHLKEVVNVKWFGIQGTEKQDVRNRIHPTQKPLELCTWFLNKFSIEAGAIVDIYGGSGSTLIACEQTNRICYMMEIDEHYCSVVVDRWEKLTGKTAEKII